MADREKTEDLATQSFPLDNLQQGVLALGMYENSGHATTNYSLDRNGTKMLSDLSEANTGMLAEKFAHDPKDVLAVGRENLFAIMKDVGLTVEKRRERVRRYVDAFLELQLKLDHFVYPPDETVRQGVPEYIPDGMTDMGSDPDPDSYGRSREKIRVNKRQLFEQAKELFVEIFSAEYGPEVTLDRLKKYVVEKIAYFVYTSMPYDYQNANPFPNMSRSVRITEAYDRKLAVCRHHAIYTQVLLQAFGLTGRLLKCNLDFGRGEGGEAHACNLVRVGGKWALLDATNPDVDGGLARIFVVPLPERDININKSTYAWSVKRKQDNETWVYTSRNNMYYKYTGNNPPRSR